jgi:DNA replication factor GINS
MNIDELRSVQSREREAASLQNLRPTFYEDAGRFIADLEAERDRAAERADDPFASPEVRRLTDDIETAKSTVEAIYERRVGKVVKMASIAAAEMPTEEENLTNEERDLFEHLVDRITANREHVLEGVLEGDGPGLSCTRDAAGDRGDGATGPADAPDGIPGDEPATSEATADPTPPAPEEPTGVPADAPGAAPADSFMGGDQPGDEADGGGRADDALATADSEPSPPEPTAGATGTTAADPPGGSAAGGDGDGPAAAPEPSAPADVDRALVRITSDVGEIFGVDDRAYELSTDEVVTLPEANADPLVEKGAAERLE